MASSLALRMSQQVLDLDSSFSESLLVRPSGKGCFDLDEASLLSILLFSWIDEALLAHKSFGDAWSVLEEAPKTYKTVLLLFETNRDERLRSSLMVVVYQKQLKLSTLGRQRHSIGEIVNYISVDAYRVGESVMWFHVGWASVVQLFLAIAVISSVVGIGVAPGSVPFVFCGLMNVPFARVMQKFQTEFMVAQDKRLRGLSSAIFFGCVLFKSALLDDVTVFTVMAELRTKSEPVRFIPEALSCLIQVKVSFERLNAFLLEDKLKQDDARRCEAGDLGHVFSIQGGCFSWGAEATSLTLEDITFEARRGERRGSQSVGPLAVGNRHFCMLFLVKYPEYLEIVLGSVAYVSQGSWIQSGTIRDNILFGKAMDKARYEEAVRASGSVYLLDDPFSAVDAHTIAALFNDCVKKTLILVTHQVEFLSTLKKIPVVEGGKVTQFGSHGSFWLEERPLSSSCLLTQVKVSFERLNTFLSELKFPPSSNSPPPQQSKQPPPQPPQHPPPQQSHQAPPQQAQPQRPQPHQQQQFPQQSQRLGLNIHSHSSNNSFQSQQARPQHPQSLQQQQLPLCSRKSYQSTIEAICTIVVSEALIC
ncbi:ABC transporter C family member 8-like isoform X2 [Salvia divinorum]|uniref:ABC transporter C family member 8-like isoform X2 n=1 Tax=Salvia divinorum TaxID=28513 RepID=A0ABD1GUL7_SALDI